MIITKNILITVTTHKRDYYEKLGYVFTIGEPFLVKVEHLTKGSNFKIEVQCDFCSRTKWIIYNQYISNTSKYNLYACSNKCAVEKGERTCLEKYGVKYPLQSKEICDNLSNYFMDKFGVSNPLKLKETTEKRDKTNIERYGVKYIFLLPEIRELTNEAAWSNEASEKRINTIHEKYEGECFMKSPAVIEKFKKTCIEKYGVDYPAQNQEIFNKTQKSGLKIKMFEGISYQGTYELDFLQHCYSIGILNEISKPGIIRYSFENKNKIYHPDFYIKKLNLIIEIKSYYYFNKFLEKNKCKQNACLEQGYGHLFIIDKNYKELDQKIGGKQKVNDI